MAVTFIKTKVTGECVARHASNAFEGLVRFQTPAVAITKGYTACAITGITKAAAAVVTSSGIGAKVTVGDYVAFDNVVGMTEINGLVGQITAKDTNTITVNINSTGFTTYDSAGAVSKAFLVATLPTGAVPTAFKLYDVTVNNAGTTATLDIGTAADYDKYVDATDLTSGGVNTVKYYRLTAALARTALTTSTPIYASVTQTGTAASTGAASVVIEYTVGA